jgi:hypothetical protein
MGAGAPADVERAGHELFMAALQQAQTFVARCRGGAQDFSTSSAAEDPFSDAALSPLASNGGALRLSEHSPTGLGMTAPSESPFPPQQWGNAVGVLQSMDH